MEGGHVLLHVRIFHLPAFPGRTIAQLPNARRSIGDMTAMSRYVGVLLTLVALTSPIAPAYAISLTDFAGVTRRGEPVDFRGSVAKPNNVSGIAVVGDRLVIVSDEIKNPTLVQVLRKEGDAYRVVLDVELPAGDDEVDLEAATADGNVVYVIGSHAATRKIDNGSIDGAQRRKSREQFFRFKLNADGSHGRTEGPKSVMPAITAHAVLAGFTSIASKENGVDIEGLAVKDGRLYFGFRGPVLRDGWVPILVTAWDDVDAAEVRYVQLDGRGIGDIAAVDDGFLILAGPVAMPTCRTASTSGTVAMSSPREAMTRGRKGSPSFPSSKAASRGTRGARYARQNV